MNRNEARLQAWAKWAIACQRMSFELTPLTGEIWDEVPRDLVAAIRLAEAALDDIKTAYGI
jgi:hypothetical protein